MTTVTKINKPSQKATIEHDAEAIFTEGRYNMWKKGELSNPTWLKKNNGHDFICLKSAKDVDAFRLYLSGQDQRQCCEYYNCFSTGKDREGKPMIVLYDQDENGDQIKRAIIIIGFFEPSILVNEVLLAIDEFCEAA